MKRVTLIFILTLIGLSFCVPATFFNLAKQKSETASLSVAIFGSLSLIFIIVLFIERLIIYLANKRQTEEGKNFYQRQKKTIYVIEITVILIVFFYFIALTNQPMYNLTITENVKCFAVFTGEKFETKNLIINFLNGNKSETISENAKVIFDNKDKIDREIETIANFEYGAMTDSYREFKVKDTVIGVRVHTIGNYQLTKQDTLKFIEQLTKLKN